MVKLASARESRLYGPWRSRNRAEYMNAGLYLLAALVLATGHVAQLSTWLSRAGLVFILIALALIAAVNLHDLLAHLAGVDFRVSLAEQDLQLSLVEFTAPVFQCLGSLLSFLAILLILLQEEKGKEYGGESNVMNLLIAGALMWLIGSIQNSCQIYERSDGHVQMLQQSVHIPFLIASLLLVVGAIINRHQLSGHSHHGLQLLGIAWIWFGISASLALVIGGLANLVKVFKMQQMGGLRLEKLRGGAQERLVQQREGQLIPYRQHDDTNKRQALLLQRPNPEILQGGNGVDSTSTPYKDVLVHGHPA